MPRLAEHDLKLNIRSLDLELIYKFIPENIKMQVLPKKESLSELRDTVDVVALVLEEKRKKRAASLRAKLHPNAWVLVRWGQGVNLGKTYLGVVKETPNGTNVLLWTKAGNYHVPSWWVQKVYSDKELEPVPSWKSSKVPSLPENHPVNVDHELVQWLEHGFFERLSVNTKVAAVTAKNDFLNWSAETRGLKVKLGHLTEDQLAALYSKLQSLRLERENERLERLNIDRLDEGTWLTVKPDRASKPYDVALIGVLDKGDSLAVWDPEEDDVEKIPTYWVQRINVQKKKVKVVQDEVSHEDRLEHSEPYRSLQVKESSEEAKINILRKSLGQKLSSTQPWPTLWSLQNKNFHKLVRERGQSLLNWFSRWHDPLLPNQESFVQLEYESSRPLIVLIVLSYLNEGETIGDFVRAEVDLLEGTVKAKDQELAGVLRKLIS